jgi:hypothetical protein
MGDASLDLEGVASDGDDGPPQALAGSVVAGGVGAMDTLAVGAQGAAPVAEGAGDTEQRIRLTVPGLPRGNLTVAVLKSRLQMYGGAMFVLDIKTRYKAPNEHIFNKGAIKRAELLDAWHRFMDTPGDQGGFDPARMLSDEDLVVRKAAPGSRAGTRAGPLTRDAARGETRALGIFERGCIGCGSHWLGERLVARGCLGGQGEAVPCVPLGLRGVCVEVQVHRLCALLLVPARQRNVTTSTRTSTRTRRTPSPSSKDEEALGDPISPRRWRIGGLLGGALCGRLIVGQHVQHAALVH